MEAFIEKAFSHFKFAEITLNFLNEPGEILNGSVALRNNIILPLNNTYTEIYSGYDSVAQKNLKRAKNAGLQYSLSDDYLPALKMYESLYADRLPSFNKTDFSHFEIICTKLAAESNLVIRYISDNRNKLLAAVILLKDNNRLYNVISGVTPEGKLAQANYFLYDQLIQEFSNAEYVLDFEGSDVKGIAEFYKRFSSQNQPYPFVKVNNLHPLLKMFKP